MLHSHSVSFAQHHTATVVKMMMMANEMTELAKASKSEKYRGKAAKTNPIFIFILSLIYTPGQMDNDISAYTYERTLMMEQRNQMLRELGLNKKDIRGVVS